MHNETENPKKLIFSLFIILIVSCFTGWFYYYNEPCHEDVFGYFYDFEKGIRITTFGQVLYLIKDYYLYWSGRKPGYFIIFLCKLFDRWVQAVFTALILSANVILIIRIIVKDTYKALSSPTLFIVLYLALYWFRPAMAVNYRWEFMVLYSFTVTLLLLYYNLAGSRFDGKDSDSVENKSKRKRIIAACLIQLLGFVAGMSHEILSFGLIALIGTEWIVDMIRRRTRFVSIFKHWGLALGYLAGFFAPGNMIRLFSGTTVDGYSASVDSAQQVSDAASATEASGFQVFLAGFKNRLDSSLVIHQVTFTGAYDEHQEYTLFLIILALALIAMAFILWIGPSGLVIDMLVSDIGFLISGISSVLMWAVSYRQPEYGVWLPTIFAYIALLEFVVLLPDIISEHSTVSTIYEKISGIIRFVVPVIAIIVFAVVYSSELSSFAHTSMARRERIAYAQENGLSEIIVPRYDDDLSPLRYSVSMMNSQLEYDTGAYTAYYGVHLIIEDETPQD